MTAKKFLVLLMTLILLVSCGGVSGMCAAKTTEFTFNGTMSEAVLRRYLSRAVSGLGICAEQKDDLILEENIRFLRRTGTKFVSRAAVFAWTCTSAAQVETHLSLAKAHAKTIHDADPEIILQAFAAEIVRRAYVDSIAIPDWVFEAFGEKPEKRNFRFADIISEKLGADHWGSEAGYPDWSRPEAQRWYYWCIRRYIDCGYESIHMQETMRRVGESGYAEELAALDRVMGLCRDYARAHARRGIVLFHSFFSMQDGGCKIGDRLLFDIQGNGLVPNETAHNDSTGAYECRISEPNGSYWCTWLGRAAGGKHPLGFTCETCPTLLEFDNYGQQGELNISNGPAFGTWGFDDISWFATQPASYRNQFLLYIEEYTKTHCLSSQNGRQYYILFPMRRCITASPLDPTVDYTPGKDFSADFLADYTEWDDIDVQVKFGGRYTLKSTGYYVANRQSDGCPNGFGQEDTIRQIFLGKNAAEDPSLPRVVLPQAYRSSSSGTTTRAANRQETTAARPAQTSAGASGTKTEDSQVTQATDISGETTAEQPTASAADSEEESSRVQPEPARKTPLAAILLPIAGVLLAAAGGAAVWLYKRKKNQNKGEPNP